MWQFQLLGGVGSEAFQPMIGPGHRLTAGGDISQRMGLRKELFGLGALAYDTSQTEAKHTDIATEGGNLSNTLAHEGLPVNGAFPSDYEVGSLQSLRQPGLAGKQFKTPGETR